MAPIVSIKSIPCPDLDCIDGKIVVHNAYSENPLIGEVEICDRCKGLGYLVTESDSTN